MSIAYKDCSLFRWIILGNIRQCLISLGVVVMVCRATQRPGKPLLDTIKGKNKNNAQHGFVSTTIQQIWDLTPQVWTSCIAMYFLLISSWGTTSSVDQTAFVITADGISISLIPLFLWVPFFAWPFSISISTSLSLYFSLSLSLPPSLPPSLSFFSRLSFSMRNIPFCVFWICECKDVWGYHVSNFSSFYAQPKGLSLIECMSKISGICVRSLILDLRQILSLRFLHFEFDCVVILGIIIPWVPLCTQSQRIFSRNWNCSCQQILGSIQCIELFYP